MSCIPASHSMTTVPSPADSPMEESPIMRRGSRVYQLFPESTMATDSESSSFPEELMYRRERLPSIVLEPTEQSEVESGELCWPRQSYTRNGDGEEEEEDSSSDQTEGSVDGEQQKQRGVEEGLIMRKSSIGPAQSQMTCSRLTPPPSPTSPEAAPPCLRS